MIACYTIASIFKIWSSINKEQVKLKGVHYIREWVGLCVRALMCSRGLVCACALLCVLEGWFVHARSCVFWRVGLCMRALVCSGGLVCACALLCVLDISMTMVQY